MAVLFFDIDGTILSSITYKIPESAIESLKEAKKKGHLLFINTGRTACDLPEELEEIPFDGYCCGCGTYIRYKREILFHSTISGKRRTEIVDCLLKLGILGVLQGTEDIYFQKENYENQELEDFRKYEAERGNGITHTLEEAGLEYDKLMLYTRDREAVGKFAAFVEADIRVLNDGIDVYECIQKDYSKGTAIKWLQNYFQWEDDELYAFGDSTNDMDMFTCVKHAIAMGKHDSVLEQKAEYVTDTVERDGIRKALKYYGIL